MDAIALWQRYQDWLYYHEGLGLYLDVSRVRFDDNFYTSMKPKFDKAFKDVEALEGERSPTRMKTGWSVTTG